MFSLGDNKIIMKGRNLAFVNRKPIDEVSSV